jgi:hypothetical protein
MKRLLIICLLTLLFISACTNNTGSQENVNVDFYAQVESTSTNEVEISLQLTADKDFKADPNFNAKMELFQQNQDLRAEANMPQNPFMKKGERYQIITWKGQLDPGRYRLVWSSANYDGIEVSFEVKTTSSGVLTIENLITKTKVGDS